jgi:nicotinic acid mononucleotide adenylyltransferase
VIDTPILVTRAGDWRPDPAERPGVLLPGSFNPVHHGHWGLAQAASDLLGRDVAFEISLVNVDKLPLDEAEVRRRLAAFRGQSAVWLTRAARFTEKAALFPGTTFVVGADTARRLVDPRYHDDDPARLRAALDRLAELDTHFLVAARRSEGAVLGLGDLSIPAPYRDRFREIPGFRLDISSTEIRQAAARSDPAP